MKFLNDRVMKPRLLCPAFHCFIARLNIGIVIYVDGSIVFICRDNEEIGLFYLNVFVVKFTTENFKINIKIKIIICSDHDCSEL